MIIIMINGCVNNNVIMGYGFCMAVLMYQESIPDTNSTFVFPIR